MRVHSPEAREKLSKAAMGHVVSDETRLKISANNGRGMLGVKLSADLRKRLSDAKIGVPWSEARIKAQELRNGGRRRKPIIKSGKEYDTNWHDLRKSIYERDLWTCQECSVHCQDKGYKKNRIQCHHIDYDVKNNGSDNLITLCASCHAKTNFQRKDWIEYFYNKQKGMIR